MGVGVGVGVGVGIAVGTGVGISVGVGVGRGGAQNPTRLLSRSIVMEIGLEEELPPPAKSPFHRTNLYVQSAVTVTSVPMAYSPSSLAGDTVTVPKSAGSTVASRKW